MGFYQRCGAMISVKAIWKTCDSAMSERFPDFLIIGAMKSGTTTLHRDLNTHPELFLPEHKEPENLCYDAVLATAGARQYARLFVRSQAQQLCGEASTAYSKLPDYVGVAQRAHQRLGEQLKIIYLVREPISRIISHHYHEYGLGLVGENINELVRSDPRFINYSRYAMQLQPWLDAFGREQIKICRFEDYIADRAGVVADICRFLGVNPDQARVQQEQVFNVSARKPVANAFWNKMVIENPLYRDWLKPRLPWSLRQTLARVLMPKAPPTPQPLSTANRAYLGEQLAEDSERLCEILSCHKPLWPNH